MLYTDCEESTLSRRSFPDTLDKYSRFDCCALYFSSSPTLRSDGSGIITKEEAENYHKLRESLGEFETHHQLLGYPGVIQNEMELECQLVTNGLYCGDPSGFKDPRAAALKDGAAAWRLLIQIDSDDQAKMMWGDLGRLYFWITDEDLRNRRFEKVWLISQCY